MKTAFNENIYNAPKIDNPSIGEVTNNDDPDRKGRIKVYLPNIFEGNDENKFWVYPSMPMGSFIVPNIGERVSVSFVDNKPNKGYYMGRIYKDVEIPQAYKDNTNNKIIYSFNNSNSFIVNEEDSTVELNIGSTKIFVDSFGKISLFNGNPDTEDVNIYSPNNLNIKSDKKLSLQGSEVEISERDDTLLDVLKKKARITLNDGEVQIGVTGSLEAKVLSSSTNHLTINSDEVVLQYNDIVKGNLNTFKIDSNSLSMFNALNHIMIKDSGVELSGNTTSKIWLNGTVNLFGVNNLLSTTPATPIAFVPSVPLVLQPPFVTESVNSVSRMTGDNMSVNNTLDIVNLKVDDFKKREGLSMTSSSDIAKEIVDIIL